jgi:hypothetical protein
VDKTTLKDLESRFPSLLFFYECGLASVIQYKNKNQPTMYASGIPFG